jgi:hypothetical protein
MVALVGVYKDRRIAEQVADALSSQPGAEDDAVRVSDAADLELSLRAEMDAEVADSWGSPGLGAFMTGEMVRGALLFSAVLGGLGLALGTIFTALLGPSALDFGERAALGAIVGTLFGGTVGTILGGGLAMKSPEDRLAAERGVTVRLEDPTEGSELIMAAHHPIRLDRISGTRRIDTITTDGDDGITETLREFRANSADPRRQG